MKDVTPQQRATGLMKALQEAGMDVIPELVKAINMIAEPDQKAKRLMELLRFLAPRFADVSILEKPPEKTETLEVLSTEQLILLADTLSGKVSPL